MIWISFLVRCDSEPQWGNNRPPNWLASTTPLHYLWTEQHAETDTPGDPDIMQDPVLQAAGAYSIGGWLANGNRWGDVDVDAYEAFRPLGNYPNGQATDNLPCLRWMGDTQYQLGDEEAEDPITRLYPPENIPFAIELRHKYFGGNANPAWDGYGWRAEFVGPAGQRNPASRAIGIYTDPQATNYWYTTGAFSQQESEWQVDDQGDPLTVWATEYNDAFLTGVGKENPADVHHAVLLGAAQEGYQTLGADQESTIHLYWETDQQGNKKSAGIGGWVDTGAVVLAHVGTLYRITDAIANDWQSGDLLRLNGLEATFTELWNGQTDLIRVDPARHPSEVPVGSVIERWE